MAQVTEADYLEAQNGNAIIRQEFVRAIDLEDAKEFVDSITYSQENNYSPYGKRLFGIKTPTLMYHDGQGSKSHIGVYPVSFKKFSFGGFLSSVIDHEGQHARQYKLNQTGYFGHNISINLRKIFPNKKNLRLYIDSLTEIPAYANELAHLNVRSFPAIELRWINDRLDTFLSYTEKYAKKHERDFERDLTMALCDSPGDDWVRENLLEVAA